MHSRWLFLIGVLAAAGCNDRKDSPPTGSPQPGPMPGMQEPAAGGNTLGAADAPYVHGSVVIAGAWTEERLGVGFAGQGADGKPHSNMAGTIFTSGSGSWVESNTFQPQLTRLDSRERANPEYRHTHMPPGDYIVYVHRGGVPAAWKKVTVKPGDQQTVNLSIDPAKTGGLTVTLPDAEANDKVRRPLLLIPADIDLPGKAWHDAFQAAEVQPGDKEVSVVGVPAGKYRAVRGKSSAEVEVVTGKTATVALIRDEPKKK